AENGCSVASSYPGTPASEILGSLSDWKKREHLDFMHVQWAINEKVAFEIAYTAAIAGLRAMVSMKQVGLNVASDPFMSAAYLGVKGGFIVISADDPGPHSSQTEQDSRMYAMSAKVPVLDPDSPAMARDMVKTGFELSEEFEIPVMLRPTTRVCHSRQDLSLRGIRMPEGKAVFEKNPGRWAATPKFRYILHKELENKLAGISDYGPTYPVCLNPSVKSGKAVVVSGICAAHAKDIFQDLDLMEKVSLYQVVQPYPLHTRFQEELLQEHSNILVIEETTGVIELQLAARDQVKGKKSGHVPSVGELSPEIVESVIADFVSVASTSKVVEPAIGKRPTLCAGCPHRASFFAIKRAAPKGIYTSDIGCYTLGMNLGAVDTVLCMGAAVSQAAGFSHAFGDDARPPVVATIGDSTFFHSGIPALIDARVQKAKFLLVILDNRTTAMTGNQPTPASGVDAGNNPVPAVNIEQVVRGCGIEYVKSGNPLDVKNFTALVKEGVSYAVENGPAVILAESPCLLSLSRDEIRQRYVKVEVEDTCDGCGYCLSHFECPAIVMSESGDNVTIDYGLCTGCGVCVSVCPKNSIKTVK
ncbi:MAG: thiamine pyrophosphate-dependent enzyme, partial [Desulfobacteraceae bacterium]